MVEVNRHVGTVTVEPMHHLEHYWQDERSALKWDCLFMLPQWLGVWWSSFGKGLETYLYVVRHHDALLGIVPLTVREHTAYLLGDSALIDYADFIVAPTRQHEFFSTLCNYLTHEGVSRFDTGRVRVDSTAVSCLQAYSAALGCKVSCRPIDVLYEMSLPDTWERYLALLSGKERHETLRKIRRLERADHFEMHVIEDKTVVAAAVDTFVMLFRSNRLEKNQFMVGAVETFFRSLAVSMAQDGFLKLFFLELNGTSTSAAMCFDYGSTVYLYNNGYDQRFSSLSVGLMSKVFSIRESIILGRGKYNFLRGGEPYKRRLGGHPIKLCHYELILT
ncbi:MAG: GNAT family N-acetyltransferase [Dissulfurispiraceae bacterium]